MNTYRAMGFTGYRFKNDSATEKFIFQNFSVKGWVAGIQTKENRRKKSSAGGFKIGWPYWPLGTPDLSAGVCVVAGVWVAGVSAEGVCVAGVWAAGVSVAGA